MSNTYIFGATSYAGDATSAAGTVNTDDNVWNSSTEKLYFVLANTTGYRNVTLTNVSTTVTFTLPTLLMAGSNVSVNSSGTGTVVSKPTLSIDYMDGNKSSSIELGIATNVYTYVMDATYSPTVTASFTVSSDLSFNESLTVCPSSITIGGGGDPPVTDEKNHVTNVTVYSAGTRYAGLNTSVSWGSSIKEVVTTNVDTNVTVPQFAYAASADVAGTDPKKYTIQNLRGSLITVNNSKVSSLLSIDFVNGDKYNVPVDKFDFSGTDFTVNLTNAESSVGNPYKISTTESVTGLSGFEFFIGGYKSINVTFDPVGGTVSPSSKKVVSGIQYGDLPEPVLTKYVFGGWYTNPEYSGDAVTASTVVAHDQDHTLYAKWTARNYEGTLYHILETGQSFSTGSYGIEIVTQTTPSELDGKVYTIKLPAHPTGGPNYPTGILLNYNGAYLDELHENQYSSVNFETHSSGTAYAFSKLTGQKVIVTQHGIGGKEYSLIKKGTNSYTNMVNAVLCASILAEKENLRYVVLGMTVVHGEYDGSKHLSNTSQYMEHLDEWQRDIDADVKNITGQTEDVKLYVTQNSYVSQTTGFVTALAQLQAPLEYPNIVFASPQYMYHASPDGGGHMYSPGYRLNGEHIGNIYAEDFLGRDTKAVYPIKISLNDDRTEINVTYHVGEGVTLQQEKTNSKKYNTDEFALVTRTTFGDDWNDTKPYYSVSISQISVSGNIVTLKLNNAIPSADVPNLYLKYKYGTIADTGDLGVSYPWNDTATYGTYESFIKGNWSAGIFNYGAMFQFPVTYDRTVKNAITITLNGNDGKVEGQDNVTKQVTYGNTYGVLPTPVRDGYTFLGWYTTPWTDAVAPEITADSYVTRTDNHGLYAHWVAGSYTFPETGVVIVPSTENTYGETDYYANEGGFTKKVATLPAPVIKTTINGSGTIDLQNGPVVYGSSPAYAISPNPGYTLDEVKVNGKSFGNITAYAFAPVTISQNISAEFTLINTTKEVTGTVAIINETIVQADESAVITVYALENTTSNINFTANSGDAGFPTVPTSGYEHLKVYGTFQIQNVTWGGESKIVINVTLNNPAEKDNIYLKHYTGIPGSGSWDADHISPASITDLGENTWQYVFETYDFSPFAVIYETVIVPSQYTSSSSHQTGYTQILSEEQAAPTAIPTVTQTPAPTQVPATPTVSPVAQPTAESTQKSPAPIVGVIAGLGAAIALVLRRT